MEQESVESMGIWMWGGIWVLYSLFYAAYFRHVAYRLKPDLDTVNLPGSPERLRAKQRICYRFSLFMLMPTLLEAIRPSTITTLIINVLPCFFGVWVMYSVWREVFKSKMPKQSDAGQTGSH